MKPKQATQLKRASGVMLVGVTLGILHYQPSQAQPMDGPPEDGPPAGVIPGPLGQALADLNLTAQQEAQVQAILEEERARTRNRVSAILTPAQRARFMQFMPGGGPTNNAQANNGRTTTMTNQVAITTENGYRYIRSNGIPDHAPGQFPNRNNPSTISAQQYNFRMPLQPQVMPRMRTLEPLLLGVALNGVPFDPGTAEYWNNNRESGWHYEAILGTLNLGLDQNNAHVQPSGAYHYHGIPGALLHRLHGDTQMALIGYAADGFPIYGPNCYANPQDAHSSLKAMKSSYRLKQGQRPGGDEGPGGTYDGTFEQDYEYVAGSGDLDEANGRYGVTPEYPGGTYYYVLTANWPVIPRRFKGRPDPSFMHQGPGPGQFGGRGPGFGPPPNGGFPGGGGGFPGGGGGFPGGGGGFPGGGGGFPGGGPQGNQG